MLAQKHQSPPAKCIYLLHGINHCIPPSTPLTTRSEYTRREMIQLSLLSHSTLHNKMRQKECQSWQESCHSPKQPARNRKAASSADRRALKTMPVLSPKFLITGLGLFPSTGSQGGCLRYTRDISRGKTDHSNSVTSFCSLQRASNNSDIYFILAGNYALFMNADHMNCNLVSFVCCLCVCVCVCVCKNVYIFLKNHWMIQNEARFGKEKKL